MRKLLLIDCGRVSKKTKGTGWFFAENGFPPFVHWNG